MRKRVDYSVLKTFRLQRYCLDRVICAEIALKPSSFVSEKEFFSVANSLFSSHTHTHTHTRRFRKSVLPVEKRTFRRDLRREPRQTYFTSPADFVPSTSTKIVRKHCSARIYTLHRKLHITPTLSCFRNIIGPVG